MRETRLRQQCLRRDRQRRIFFVTVLLVLILGVSGGSVYVYHDLLGGLSVEPGTLPSGYTLPSIPLEEEPEDPDFEDVEDISDAAGLRDFLKKWYDNGGDENIRYSKDVVNVLLLGIDNDEGTVGAGRSDTQMVVSINKKLRTITLLSILRDSYCYMNAGGVETYTRVNAATFYGGPAGMMETLSRLYKIKIDRYISVDFDSFPKLIDALGGVDVEVTEAEARYINRTAPSMKGAFPASGYEGHKVRLNGKQALVYSRIRQLDSDMDRVGRQQKVIESIIESAKTASAGQIYNALDQTLPYVKTNYTRSQIIKLVPQALGWLNYPMRKLTNPVVDEPGDYRNVSCAMSYINGMFLWLVDYPLAAHQVQTALYGDSKISYEHSHERDREMNELFYRATDSRYLSKYEGYHGVRGNYGWGYQRPGETEAPVDLDGEEPNGDDINDGEIIEDTDEPDGEEATQHRSLFDWF